MKKISELRISFLRQWLNEDRIDNPKKMVSNADIKYWLDLMSLKEYRREKKSEKQSTEKMIKNIKF